MRFALVIVLCTTTTSYSIAQDRSTQREIPFSDLRAFLPKEGQAFDVFRHMAEGQMKPDDERDDYFQLALGRILKANPADRTPQNEPAIREGLLVRDGYLEVVAGWRGRTNNFIITNFDGTVSGKLALSLSKGKWTVTVIEVNATWNRFFVIPNAAGEKIEKHFRDDLPGHVATELNKAFEKIAENPLTAALFLPGPLDQLSAKLSGDKLVLIKEPQPKLIKPLLDLGHTIDRSGARQVTTPVGDWDKLHFGTIDRSVVDTSASTIHSTIRVAGKIDGRSVTTFRLAEQGTFVLEDKLDGLSTLKIVAPKGNVKVMGEVNGASHLTIDAPGGRVEFHGWVNGHSRLFITADTVVFHKPIDGGKETQVDVVVTKGGSITIPDLRGLLHYRRADPTDPAPKIHLGRTEGDKWELREIRDEKK